ncbi:putative Replication factor-A C terminal domain containing protein [Trypanosoma cruzi]|nr:putative Replication factor-A C terminal domain containing protein [Trypanosoma cruzi]
MDALSTGFCASAMKGVLPHGPGESWASLWPSPRVQVVDIQRYPKIVTEPFVVSRFYVAVSDSASLIWLVVPPGSEMEELIDTFQIEVGSCITLNEYSVVAAKNALNVVVPLSITYSGNELSLLGNPTVEETLFCLSTEALTKRRGAVKPNFSRAIESYIKISLIDFVDAKGHELEDYALDLRIIWKGKQRHLTASGSMGRFVFDCIGVDRNGDAVSISCTGQSGLYDIFSLGDCVCVTNACLTSRSEAEDTMRLQLNERSFVVLRGEEAVSNIPTHPCRMFGARSVTNLINYSNVGDIVHVEGVVTSVSSATLVNTRRGRVERSGISLQDPASSSLIDVTLWEEFSRSVRPNVGERWCFCGFVVGEFMRRLTLSSRYGSGAFQMKMTPQKSLLPVNRTEKIPFMSLENKDSLQVVLDLEEASETLPVLAKIQRVRVPLTCVACRGCGKQIRSKASSCAACGGSTLEERFFVRLELSDGICAVSAVGFAQIGETLFGMDLPTLMKQREESPGFEGNIARDVVGLPLLFWLLRSPDDSLLHVVKCQHIDMARCAATLLGALAQMMGPSFDASRTE